MWKKWKFIEVHYGYSMRYGRGGAAPGLDRLEDVLMEGFKAKVVRRPSRWVETEETSWRSVALCVWTTVDVAE